MKVRDQPFSFDSDLRQMERYNQLEFKRSERGARKNERYMQTERGGWGKRRGGGKINKNEN